MPVGQLEPARPDGWVIPAGHAPHNALADRVVGALVLYGNAAVPRGGPLVLWG